jgi:hypothetical protein
MSSDTTSLGDLDLHLLAPVMDSNDVLSSLTELLYHMLTVSSPSTYVYPDLTRKTGSMTCQVAHLYYCIISADDGSYSFLSA